MNDIKNVNQVDRSFNEIQYIKDNVSIVDIIGDFTTLKRSGIELKGLCPFHSEHTPSFVVYEKTQSFCCFGCGVAGDVFTFMMNKTNLNFGRVKELLVSRYGLTASTNYSNKNLTREMRTKLDGQPEARSIRKVEKIPPFDLNRIYSKKRGMYIPLKANGEMYQYIYGEGTIAGYIYFGTDDEGKKVPFPISLIEKLNDDKTDTEIVWAYSGLPSPKPIYNIMEVIQNKTKPILVVEGERCATKAKELLKDFVVTTWSGGSNATGQTDWSHLEKKEVFIWPDNDPNGLHAAELIALQLPNVEILKLPDNKPKGWDIADAIKEGQSEKELTEYILSHRIDKEKKPDRPLNFKMPPGLLGELSEYILSACYEPHPLLAVGAALSIMSILQAQKVMTVDGIHPNLYLMALAPIGVGKGGPLNQIKLILDDIGCDKLCIGTPASGAGLISALDRNKGRALMPIDEIGNLLKQVLHDKGGPRQNLVEYLLKLFSDSQTNYKDIEYSNRDGKGTQRIISKPNLTIYGTGNATNFYEAISIGSTLDGLLARFLVLEGVDTEVQTVDSKDLANELPTELRDKLIQLAADPINIITSIDPMSDVINQEDAVAYNFQPAKIYYVKAAKDLMSKYKDLNKERTKAHGLEGDNFRAGQYGRAWEIASKLALLSRKYSGYIDVEAAQWAIEFVDMNVANLCHKAGRYIYTDFFHAKTQELQRYFEKRMIWMTKKQILNQFRIKTNDFKERLDYLIEAGIVEHRTLVRKEYSPDKTTFIPQWRIIPEYKKS